MLSEYIFIEIVNIFTVNFEWAFGWVRFTHSGPGIGSAATGVKTILAVYWAILEKLNKFVIEQKKNL